MSVRSWRIFCSSTMQSATMRAGRTRQPVRGAGGGEAMSVADEVTAEAGMAEAVTADAVSGDAASADTGGCGARGTDIAELSRGRLIKGVAGVVAEDVFERARAGRQRGLELLRRAGGPDRAAVHERDPVAELVGLVHVVRRDEHRHAGR